MVARWAPIVGVASSIHASAVPVKWSTIPVGIAILSPSHNTQSCATQAASHTVDESFTVAPFSTPFMTQRRRTDAEKVGVHRTVRPDTLVWRRLSRSQFSSSCTTCTVSVLADALRTSRLVRRQPAGKITACSVCPACNLVRVNIYNFYSDCSSSRSSAT